MVISNLMGGLGNQIFQYAAGRALSLRLNAELKLDHSFLETKSQGAYTQRHYELDVFHCAATRASSDDLAPAYKARDNHFLYRLFARHKFTWLAENGFPFNKQIENVEGNVYLHGFWQSEKYFAGIRQTLLGDFTLKQQLSEAAASLKNKIQGDAQSVSVHFRRGDYVTLQSASAFHGTAGLDYYTHALEMLQAKVNSPSLYVFSDDIEWVKQHFKQPGAVYVAGLKGYEDLELMKNCRHNIVANSSFSWWGAWLNANPGKVVIAPRQWFKDPSINTVDLIPQSWLKV